MRVLLLFVFTSLTALPLVASISPTQYHCVGEDQRLDYGTTDIMGQPYLTANGVYYRFGKRQGHWLWTQTLLPDGSTDLTGNFARGFMYFSLKINIPPIKLDSADKSAPFNTKLEYFDEGATTPISTSELACEAFFVVS